MNTPLSAGWYPADGDPPGTQRYWDGAQWVGGPQAIDTTEVGGPVGQPPGPVSPRFVTTSSSYLEKSQATLGLVLSLLSVLVCGILAPFGWYICSQEVNAIDAGRRDPKNRSMAAAGKILGIIVTILMLLTAVGIIFLIVLAVPWGVTW